jgi:tRNA-2-methylthio-N6-dimethylallyladenosine synthase
LRLRRYYLWNIGCQMNRADAYRVGEELEKRGYAPTSQPEMADVIVLNTCVVRLSAEDRVVGRLSSLSSLKRRTRGPVLLVMGCFVDDVPTLEARFPFVDAFFKPSDIVGLVRYVERWEEGQDEGAACTQPIAASHIAELVPISYGCDHHCTYCIVTLRRGRQRSRPIPEIARDVQRLAARGAREVTLLGQNVDAYGSDLPDHPSLADILRSIHDIEGLWRIRFLTSHPRDMTQAIIDTVASLPRACECWELPVQSGDDAILRRMARGYTVEHFCDLVSRIRGRSPRCAINTDVIVGFPGETEAQFENTLRLVREVRFDVVHVAAYSVRPGTTASAWEDDVVPKEKERRRALIEQVQGEVAGEINAAFLGQEVEVLVDGRQRGRWRGRTRTNKLVFFEGPGEWQGRLARVRVTWTGPWSMLGQVVS